MNKPPKKHPAGCFFGGCLDRFLLFVRVWFWMSIFGLCSWSCFNFFFVSHIFFMVSY